MLKREYHVFADWKTDAKKLGWVHAHDNLVVCDDPDSDLCVGEWDDEESKGWLLS